MERKREAPATISSTGNHRTGAAFTLVELLVALGIMGLMVGLSVPAFGRFNEQLRLKASVRDVMGLLSLARSLAISSGDEHAVVVDPEQRRIRVVNLVSSEALERVARLPNTVTVEMQSAGQPLPEPQVVFRGSGALKGRAVSVILADRHRRQTILVSGATGALSLN